MAFEEEITVEKYFRTGLKHHLLSVSEDEFLRQYTNYMYIEINKSLRSGIFTLYATLGIKALDNLMLRAPKLEHDTVVYRGMPIKLTNGKYIDDAFLSTTSSRKIASKFTSSGCCIYSIIAKAGLPYLRGSEVEEEYIFPRGLTLEVNDTSSRSDVFRDATLYMGAGYTPPIYSSIFEHATDYLEYVSEQDVNNKDLRKGLIYQAMKESKPNIVIKFMRHYPIKRYIFIDASHDMKLHILDEFKDELINELFKDSSMQLLKELLKFPLFRTKKYNLLINSVRLKLYSFVHYMLSHSSIDINLQDDDGNTALLLAIKNIDNISIHLLDAPAINVNLQDIHLNAPIHIAMLTRQVDVLNKLVKNPTLNVNILDKNNRTPLMLMCLQNNNDFISLLLNTGRVLVSEPIDDMNKNAIDYAIESGNDKICNNLVSYAHDDDRLRLYAYLDDVNGVLAGEYSMHDLNFQNERTGENAFMIAARYNSLSFFEKFARECDFTLRNNEGKTVKMIAIENGNEKIISLIP